MVKRSGATNGLARLVENVHKCLGSSASEFFELKEDNDLSGLKDKIKFEITSLQLEPNLSEKYKMDNGTKNTNSHLTGNMLILW